ncbi:hypothetical protein HK405_011777 [Cladochytrium tenue]|nr:hypothetical protein HK405_011777 [Cladochytrium tenue]
MAQLLTPPQQLLVVGTSGGPSSSPAAIGSGAASDASGLTDDDGALLADPGEPIRCLWSNPPCSLLFADAEALYNHLTNDHVGRKKTNNLCLECRWEACGVVANKRDHLTSHIRIHIPLKPHSCPVCARAFKRPQDLKKHEKVHSDRATSSGDDASPAGIRASVLSRPIAHPRQHSGVMLHPSGVLLSGNGQAAAHLSVPPSFMSSPPASLNNTPSINSGSLSPPFLPQSPSISESSDLSDDQTGKKRTATDVFDEFLEDARTKKLAWRYDTDMQKRLDDLSAVLGLGEHSALSVIGTPASHGIPQQMTAGIAAPQPPANPDEIDLDTFLLQLSNEIMPEVGWANTAAGGPVHSLTDPAAATLGHPLLPLGAGIPAAFPSNAVFSFPPQPQLVAGMAPSAAAAATPMPSTFLVAAGPGGTPAGHFVYYPPGTLVAPPVAGGAADGATFAAPRVMVLPTTQSAPPEATPAPEAASAGTVAAEAAADAETGTDGRALGTPDRALSASMDGLRLSPGATPTKSTEVVREETAEAAPAAPEGSAQQLSAEDRRRLVHRAIITLALQRYRERVAAAVSASA